MTPFVAVWLRNDLRLRDNLAITQAQLAGLPLVLLFIATADSWQQQHMASIKQDLIRRRVCQLQEEAAALGLPLLALEVPHYRHCADLLLQFATVGAQAVYFQTEYPSNEQRRDTAVIEKLAAHGIPCHLIDTYCLFAPGTVLTGAGEPYKVFTPFKNNWLNRFRLSGVHCQPLPHRQATVELVQSLQQLALPQMAKGDNSSAAWPVVELDVLQRLRQFCQQSVQDYRQQRDFPALSGTSTLSPYLAIGVISAQQAVARLWLEQGDQIWRNESGAAVWLSELIWRDFYQHILVAYPELIKHQPFQHYTADIRWRNNQQWFDAWCQGQTGYPLVDAAMRQLNNTGWMHNRLRMITAGFLVKDLQIDWRWGERYFMSKLIDGDFAANNGGWQWAASTGTDAVPYFRIFNPVTQSQRFDPKGKFIRSFLPELASLSDKQIHWPHPLPSKIHYYAPLVIHQQARQLTLALFQQAKAGG